MITSVWPLVARRCPCLRDVRGDVGAGLVDVSVAAVGRVHGTRACSVAAWVGPLLGCDACISTKAHEGLSGRITSM